MQAGLSVLYLFYFAGMWEHECESSALEGDDVDIVLCVCVCVCESERALSLEAGCLMEPLILISFLPFSRGACMLAPLDTPHPSHPHFPLPVST